MHTQPLPELLHKETAKQWRRRVRGLIATLPTMTLDEKDRLTAPDDPCADNTRIPCAACGGPLGTICFDVATRGRWVLCCRQCNTMRYRLTLKS